MNQKRLKNFELVISIRAFKTQLKEIDALIKKYPELWDGRSMFYRSSANYFIKHIKGDKFKVSFIE